MSARQAEWEGLNARARLVCDVLVCGMRCVVCGGSVMCGMWSVVRAMRCNVCGVSCELRCGVRRAVCV